MKWLPSVALMLLSFMAAGQALAMRSALGFGVGAEYSDNIELAPSDGEAAWVGVAGASLQMQERSAGLDADLLGEAQYRNYQTQRFDDDWVLLLEAVADWHLEPDLDWHLEDYFQQYTTDVFAAPTPANRQNTNVFTTGPERRWRFSPVHSLVAGARISDFYFEQSDADSRRLSGYGRWVWLLSSRMDLSVNGELTGTDYAANRYLDYRRGDLFLRLTRRWARATGEADLGTTAVRRDRSGDINGFLGRLAWHYLPNSYSGVDAFVMHQYTDPGHDILATAGRDGAVGLVDEQISGDVFYTRHLEAAYHREGVRSRWRLALAQRSEDYEWTQRQHEFKEGYFDFGYDFSATLAGRLTMLYSRADYKEVGQVNTDRRIGAGLHYRITPRLRAGLELFRTERDSNVAAARYSENRALISFSYEPPEFQPSLPEE